MALSPGTRLGPYEVIAPLGAGGMGEVYRAKDTRLDRTVALKVLLPQFSADAERRQRLEREARAVSSLSHSHICALYDVGRENGVDYFVMEYLEGQTLEARLRTGPLPLEPTLRHGIEIAEALEKAHRQGIVHRDLKPANIMLTKSGVKLLDFGLAKLRRLEEPSEASGVDAAEDQTLTGEGRILGTLPYMAPEQVQGKPADARTDIFALGAILYETTTGRRAFAADTRPSVIAAILEREPPAMSSRQPATPPGLERVVRACLAKDPDDRLQTAHDVMQALKWTLETLSPPGGSRTDRRAARGRTLLLWSLLAAALSAAALAVVHLQRPEPLPPPPVLLSLLPPDKHLFAFDRADSGEAGAPPALSPDGRWLVFGAMDSANRIMLWLRALDSEQTQPLAGTEGGGNPFWSPDGRSIGFFADNKLKRLDIAGGLPQTLCDVAFPWGGTWSGDGRILFGRFMGPISEVSASGGSPHAVTRIDSGQTGLFHTWPSFLPDGRRFLYLAQSGNQSVQKEWGGIFVASLDTNQASRLLADISNAQVAGPGHLLFVKEGVLMAAPFDTRRARLTGPPQPVAPPLQFDPGRFYSAFTASQTGLIAYRRKVRAPDQLVWHARGGGRGRPLGDPMESLGIPRISPNGQRVVIARGEGAGSGLWLMDLVTGTRSRFMSGLDYLICPVWSPDGRRIAFSSWGRGRADLYVKDADSAGVEQLLLQSDDDKYLADWSSDGRFLCFLRDAHDRPDSRLELWGFSLADGKAFPIVKGEYRVSWPAFSPDSRWIAYASDETGREEVHVTPFPGPGGRRQISTEGGFRPRWRGDGHELTFRAGEGVMAVDIRTTPSLTVGVPHEIYRFSSQDASYDMSPDGRRLLVATRVETGEQVPLTVVSNWSGLLKK